MVRPLAVVVGIAAYDERRLKLETPTRDAVRLAALLESQHGYEVWLRRDQEATKAKLDDLFARELPAAASEDRAVVVYFAGHGIAVNSLTEPQGYLVPTDGRGDVTSLFPMSRLNELLGALNCKHLLLILDCCYAGAYRWSAGRDFDDVTAPEMYRERYELFLRTPAWQVLTSAAYDERAADVIDGLTIGERDDAANHSPFLKALAEGLEGAADIAGNGDRPDGVITATELYIYLRQELEIRHRQTPGLWLLPKHRKGEFIFRTPGRDLTLIDAGPLARETSPYRGFEAYEEQHAKLFHGRRGAIKQLAARVLERPLTVVIGASGSGKSSLVRAGLLPVLRENFEILPIMRPGTTPLASLTSALEARTDGKRAVLVIDQLEELLVVERATDRTPFLERLRDLVADETLRIVATLRSDLETEMWSSPLAGTWEAVRFPLGDMTRGELREAVEKPAELRVLTFHPPDLVERLVDTVVSMPGALPLLSFTLQKLYLDCLQRGGGDRRLVELEAVDVGGISLSLREHAERVYASFDSATQKSMQQVLLRMVSLKGASVTRRQVPRAELDYGTAEENDRVRRVIETLASPDVRFVVRGADPTGAYVELAHDAIARDWPRFREWTESGQADLLLHRALTQEAVDWSRGNRQRGYLWNDDPRLELARSRLPADRLNVLESGFLAESRDARRRRRLLIYGIPAVLIPLVLAAAGIAWIQTRAERSTRVLAEDRASALSGTRAGALSRVPGREIEAGQLAVSNLRAAIDRGRQAPPAAIAGAAEVSGRLRRIDFPVTESNLLYAACSPDASHVLISHEESGVYLGDRAGHLTRVDGTAPSFAGVFTGGGTKILVARGGQLAERTLGAAPVTVGDDGPIIAAISVAADGSTVVGRVDGSIQQRERNGSLTDLEPFGTDDEHFINSVAISANSQWLAASSLDGRVRVWRSGIAQPYLEISAETLGDKVIPRTVSLTSDGRYLLLAGTRTSVWDVFAKTETRQLPMVSTLYVTSGAFSAEGTEFVLGANDGVVSRWSTTTGQLLEFVMRVAGKVRTVAYCSETELLVGSTGGSVTLLDSARSNAASVLSVGNQPIEAALLDRYGKTAYVAVGMRTGSKPRVAAMDVESGAVLRSVELDIDPWLIAPAREGVLVGQRDGTILAWATGTPTPVFSEGASFRGFFSSDGKLYAQPTLTNVVIWRVQSHERVGEIAARNWTIGTGGFSANNERVALLDCVAATECSVAIWSVDGKTKFGSLPIQGDRPLSAALSPDGTRVIVAGSFGSVTEWDIASQQVFAELPGHVGGVRSVAFSNDGESIVSAGDDGTARVWDARTGSSIAVLTGHRGSVFSAAFSANSQSVITGGLDGTVRIYPATAAGTLALLCKRTPGCTP